MEGKEKKLHINIDISGTNYPLHINAEEEELYRKAALQLNKFISLYKQYYSSSGRNDLEATKMAAFQSTVEWIILANEQDEDPTLVRIKELNDKLERFAKENDSNL